MFWHAVPDLPRHTQMSGTESGVAMSRRWCEVAGMVEDSYECGHCGKCAGVTDGGESSTRKKAVQHLPKSIGKNKHGIDYTR